MHEEAQRIRIVEWKPETKTRLSHTSVLDLLLAGVKFINISVFMLPGKLI